ncbi:hypothetical protein FRX31_014814 [Thalictrum thalictroides]|uniref:DUF8039 domain-containing protein n=1 Tax=Thalictrum thalictroides TaxID=46969 RepID=A0A7J6WFH3_THATH|nr:hypothetical protein FRX31_014814 [Thalictrum thalictroides]
MISATVQSITEETKEIEESNIEELEASLEGITIGPTLTSKTQREKVTESGEEGDTSDEGSSSTSEEEAVDEDIPKKCCLSLKRKWNIVAYVRVHSKNGPKQLVHGIALGEDNVRVSIDKAKFEKAPLPVPSFDLETVKDAVGAVVAWPLKFVTEVPKAPVTRTKSDKVEKQTTKGGKKQMVQVEKPTTKGGKKQKVQVELVLKMTTRSQSVSPKKLEN